MKRTQSDIREEKLNTKLSELAEKEDWDGVVQALDDFDANNERRHAEHRANLDITTVDRDPEEPGNCCRMVDLLRLSSPDDWLEAIFSQVPEDLWQLVEEYPTSSALRELTPAQTWVLFENVVHGVPTDRIADELGCSVRNVTKHRQKALERVRELVTGDPKLRKDSERKS